MKFNQFSCLKSEDKLVGISVLGKVSILDKVEHRLSQAPSKKSSKSSTNIISSPLPTSTSVLEAIIIELEVGWLGFEAEPNGGSPIEVSNLSSNVASAASEALENISLKLQLF